MKEFEWQMAWYEGPELRCIEPSLLPGEKEIISDFHDESFCQANEFKIFSMVCSIGGIVWNVLTMLKASRRGSNPTEKRPWKADSCLRFY